MKKMRLFNVLSLVSLEMGIAGTIFCISPYGYTLLRNLGSELQEIQKDISSTTTRIGELEDEINNWKNYSFYKEKYCCENLQMMHPDTTTYYIE